MSRHASVSASVSHSSLAKSSKSLNSGGDGDDDDDGGGGVARRQVVEEGYKSGVGMMRTNGNNGVVKE